MGLNDHIADEKRSKGKGRGSVNNAARLAGLKPAGKESQGDWGSADPRWIAAVVVAISSRGGAVSFGLSRDGGAHSLTLMLDGERQTLWFNGDADLDAELEKVFAFLDTL